LHHQTVEESFVIRRAAVLFLLGAVLARPAGLTPVDEAGYAKLLSANKGKVVLVNFWATWCQPCRKEMPELVRMAARFKAKGFVFLTITADEPEQEADALKFLSQSGVTLPAFIKRAKDDEKFINSVETKWSGALPVLLLYDRAGGKSRFFQGETDLKALESAIQKIL
jgi:thiol-disulfide isomerase/thioredoxin